MESTKEKQHRKIYIRSAEDLFAALREPDPASRAAVLQAIQKDPRAALAYGKANGRDLVDELLSLCSASVGSADRTLYAAVLFSFDDERVKTFAKKEFLRTENTRALLLSAEILARLPQEERAALLPPALLRGKNPVRSRAAANLLADCRHLAADVKLRTAILSDHSIEPPEFTPETAQVWIAELQGEHCRKTRNVFLRLGNQALEALLGMWPYLAVNLQKWLLYQLMENQTTGAAEKIEEILRDQREALLAAALECRKKLQTADDSMLQPLTGHPDPDVRAAAIEGIKHHVDWSNRIYAENKLKVRLAIMNHMSRFGGKKDADILAELLSDDSWRIRARASKCLASMAPLSLEALKNAFFSDTENVRVAAAQALQALGEERWLAQQM